MYSNHKELNLNSKGIPILLPLRFSGYFITLVFLIVTFTSGHADTLNVFGNFSNFTAELRKEVYVLEDSTTNLTIKDVLNAQKQNKFYQNPSTGAFSTGFSRSVF